MCVCSCVCVSVCVCVCVYVCVCVLVLWRGSLCFLNKYKNIWAHMLKCFFHWNYFVITFWASIGVEIWGTCIKGQIWPPLEPKTGSCFSPISPNWFIRRMVQV